MDDIALLIIRIWENTKKGIKQKEREKEQSMLEVLNFKKNVDND